MTAKGLRVTVVFLGLIGLVLQTTHDCSVTWGSPPVGVLLLPEDVDLPSNAEPIDDPEIRKSISKQILGTEREQGDRAIPPEIMELIEKTGSVIQGSSLDVDIKAPHVNRSPSESSDATRQRLRAAEMLLKSARLLDKVHHSSENQKRLVNQMRQEAVRLMVAESEQDLVPVHSNMVIAETADEPSEKQR